MIEMPALRRQADGLHAAEAHERTRGPIKVHEVCSSGVRPPPTHRQLAFGPASAHHLIRHVFHVMQQKH